MDKTNVKVKFIIIGDELNPNDATEKLRIKPSQYWVKGDDIKNREIKRKDNCWIINTEYEESYDINQQLLKIIKLIKDKKGILEELKDTYSLEYIFAIIINVENNEKPAMYFNREFIQFINDIRAEFYIDLYVY